MNAVIAMILYFFLAPFIGGLLTGFDRKISARMQARQGPPLLQPFYDVLKLMTKENLVVRRSQNLYLTFFLIFTIFTGGLFFTGHDLLLVIFAFTLGGIFLVLGAYKASSPYSIIGAEREMLQVLAYEPMVILTAVGIYMVTQSFQITDIIHFPRPLFFYLPGIFLGFVYILTIKLRKSPFDLSLSHHAHQELVQGIATEFSGSTLAAIHIAHWYETVLLLGFVYLFFAAWPLVGVVVALGLYFFEILIDNTFARMKWEFTVQSSWTITFVFGISNIIVLSFLKTFALLK